MSYVQQTIVLNKRQVKAVNCCTGNRKGSDTIRERRTSNERSEQLIARTPSFAASEHSLDHSEFNRTWAFVRLLFSLNIASLTVFRVETLLQCTRPKLDECAGMYGECSCVQPNVPKCWGSYDLVTCCNPTIMLRLIRCQKKAVDIFQVIMRLLVLRPQKSSGSRVEKILSLFVDPNAFPLLV